MSLQPPALPSPAELSGHSSAFASSDGQRFGAEFDPQLPHNLVTAQQQLGLFDPLGAGQAPALSDLAYAIYSFRLHDSDNEDSDISIDWTTAPAPAERWVGLSNFSSNRWRWFSGPGNSEIHLDALSDYLDAGDNFYLAVVVAGSSGGDLREIRITVKSAPVAVISSDVDSGSAPLVVSFSAAGSFDIDGTIEDYEWDFDGDRTYSESGAEQAAHGSATPAALQFSESGLHEVRVRVTDDSGKRDSARQEIHVSQGLPPTARLTAAPLHGATPLQVNFDASASNDPEGSIEDYEWDLDGNGVYNEAGPELEGRGTAELQYDYEFSGSFEARVRVTASDGDRDSAMVVITPGNQPPVAILTGTPLEGESPVLSTLNAGSSHDPDGILVDYEWDLDGDGLFNESGAESIARGSATPEPFLYETPGTAHPSLRVTDDDGASAIAQLDIIVHGWVVIDLDEGISGAGHYTRISVIDGRPAISHVTMPNNTVRYAVSATPLGVDEDDWSFFEIDSSNSPGKDSSLAEVNGHPAIAWFNVAGEAGLAYKRATSTDGAEPGDWPAAVVVDSGAGGEGLCLAEVAGKAALAYHSEAAQELRYAWSATLDGMQAVDWSDTSVVSPADPLVRQDGLQPQLLVADGLPKIVFGALEQSGEHQLDHIGLAWNANAQGDGAWSHNFFNGFGALARNYDHEARALGGSLLVMTTSREGSNPGNRGVWFFRGLPNEQQPGGFDWTTKVLDQSMDGQDEFAALTVFQSMPVAAYYDAGLGDVMYREAIGMDEQGPVWSDELNVAPGGDVQGSYLDMTTLAGDTNPALVFRNVTRECVTYVVRF